MSRWYDNEMDAGVRTEWVEAQQPFKALARSLLAIFNDARRYFSRIIDPPKYTYFVSVHTDPKGYRAGETGVAQAVCNTPYEIIDLVVVSKSGTFNLTSFFIGDVNQIMGAGCVPADMFGPAVQDRFLRTHEVQRGQLVQIGFANVSRDETPQAITFALKVRSYRRC